MVNPNPFRVLDHFPYDFVLLDDYIIILTSPGEQLGKLCFMGEVYCFDLIRIRCLE